VEAMAALSINNLSKTYPNGVKALKNLSFFIGNSMFGRLMEAHSRYFDEQFAAADFCSTVR
jgi:hypothetical protein